MKKIITLLFCFVFIFYNFDKSYVYSNENATNTPLEQLSISSPSAILMEYSTGKILFNKNSEEKMYPASMTKMMAMYLFLESIALGNHSFDEIIQISSYASSMGGSQIFLKENEKMSFDDLFKAVTIASANDAVVALAEHTYGNINSFIDKMNVKAKEFNMYSTNFTNVTGFHDSNHYTTAKDMATLAQKLLKDYGDIVLKYSSTYDTYLRENTASPFWLVNTNRMLKFYQGMDGLKTGYTSDSGFNLTATAKRNDLRFITVIMGSESSKQRNQDTSTLLDYGFNNYKLVKLYEKGSTITTHTFEDSKLQNTQIIVKEDITYLLRKNENPKNLNIQIEIETQKAPISKDTCVGKIAISHFNSNDKVYFNLYTENNVEKISYFELVIKYWKALIS